MCLDFGLIYPRQRDRLGSDMKTNIIIMTDTRVGIPGGSERHLYNFLSNISDDFDVKVFQLNPVPNQFLSDGYLHNKKNVKLESVPLQSIVSLNGIAVFFKLLVALIQFKPQIVVSYHEKSDILNYLLSKIPFLNR